MHVGGGEDKVQAIVHHVLVNDRKSLLEKIRLPLAHGVRIKLHVHLFDGFSLKHPIRRLIHRHSSVGLVSTALYSIASGCEGAVSATTIILIPLYITIFLCIQSVPGLTSKTFYI